MCQIVSDIVVVAERISDRFPRDTDIRATCPYEKKEIIFPKPFLNGHTSFEINCPCDNSHTADRDFKIIF